MTSITQNPLEYKSRTQLMSITWKRGIHHRKPKPIQTCNEHEEKLLMFPVKPSALTRTAQSVGCSFLACSKLTDKSSADCAGWQLTYRQFCACSLCHSLFLFLLSPLSSAAESASGTQWMFTACSSSFIL